MLIRDANPDELAEIGAIRVAAYLADGFLSGSDDGYGPHLRDLGADGVDPVLVAVDDGVDAAGEAVGPANAAGKAAARPAGPALLGTVMLQVWPRAGEIVRGPDEAEIRALAVRPEARGAGVGKALVAAVIARAAGVGVRHLVLCSQTEMKTAHHLYEEAGFARLPDRDWEPVPGVMLLAFGLELDHSS
ncbi:MAG TPA: GNAT family N-acetyltransferase [Streptosporangiaceae bacterium]